MTRDHDQAQLDLRFASELIPMRFVILVHFRRRSDAVELDIFASHRLDDNFLGLYLFEFAHGEVLGFERFNEGIAVAAEILPENFVDSLFDEMIRNLKVVFFKRLNDQLAIDQILECGLAGLFNFFDELVAAELGTK